MANAISPTMLSEHVGISCVGVVLMPEHVVPAIKIGGTVYVVDHNAFRTVSRAAFSIRGYARQLARANRDVSHPLHRVALNFELGPREKAAAFAGKMVYAGGNKPALAGTQINLAHAFESIGNFRQALKHFAKAGEFDPRNI
ncbi:MAG: tetratricopeptide repeat protein [Candidatus Micrarchaeota archaeon]